MAHIEQLDSGKFKAIVEIGTGSKRKRRTRTFVKQKEAEKWMANLITEQDQGTLVDPDKITLSQYFERFLENKKYEVATTTYENYVKRYEAHIKPDLGYMRLQDIKPFHLEEYFTKKRVSGKIRGKGGLSNNTLKKIYVLLNQCLKKALQFQLIKQNPLDPISTPKVEKTEVDYMQGKELNQLLVATKEHDFFMFTFSCFLFYTGLRKSEALGLDWSCIDYDASTVEIKQRLIYSKGNGPILEEKTKNDTSRRKIKLSGELIKLMKKYKAWQLENRLTLGDEYKEFEYKDKKLDLVFCKPDGQPYYPTSLNKKMKRAMTKAVLPYKSQIHILRHTFATVNVNNKVGAEIVQKMLGHSTIKTTLDIYYHHDVDQQDEAINNLDKMINIEL